MITQEKLNLYLEIQLAEKQDLNFESNLAKYGADFKEWRNFKFNPSDVNLCIRPYGEGNWGKSYNT